MPPNTSDRFDRLLDLMLGVTEQKKPSDDQRLVNLDDFASAAERGEAIDRAHVFANQVTHAPCGLIGNTKLTLDFLGGNTVTRSAELEHNKEPIAQRRAGAVKGRSCGRVNLMSAPLALVGATASNTRVAGGAIASGAVKIAAVANLKHVIKTAILGGKAALKLTERGSFRIHTHYMPQRPTCFKGIIAKSFQGPFPPLN